MPLFQPGDIGPIYDFGIATRDGSTLPCLNKNGKTVQISKVAFMSHADKANLIKEATELQHKDQLIQFASSNLVDREFDQWPQVSQGDWSGGIGQRVFATNNDKTRYWDGEGLLWPTADWVPQQALRGPTQGLPQGGSASPGAPDSGTETAAPGGSTTVQQAALVFASLVATGVVAQVGALGPFTTGTNTAVAPTYGQGTVAGHGLACFVSGQRQSMSASANLGSTGAATFTSAFNQGQNNIVFTPLFTVPAGGIYINSISVYCGGHGGSCNFVLGVWNSSGTLLVNSSTFSAGSGNALRTQSVTQTFVAAGTQIYIGFWFDPGNANGAQWGETNGGDFKYYPSSGKVNSIGNIGSVTDCSSGFFCGNMQAYVSYTQLNVSEIVQSNAGAAPGWVMLKQQNSPDGYQTVQEWARVNCGNNETAPAFAAAQGGSPMHARLGEFTNISLTSPPTDQSSSASNQNQTSISATNPAVDTATGDLVMMGGRFSLSQINTCSFTKSFNNNMATIDAGDTGATSVQQHSAFAFAIVPSGPATFSQFTYNGTAGGFIDGLGMGYAATYLDNQAPAHWHACFFAGDQYFDVDLGANTGGKQGPLHMQIACGYLWVLFSENPNTVQLSVRMCGCAYGSNTFTQLRNDLIAPVSVGTSNFLGLIRASFVGGHLYAAVLQADADQPPNSPGANNRNALYVLDYSSGTGAVPSGLAAPVVQFPFERGFRISELVWQGSNLVVAVSDGFNAYVYNLAAPFTTVTTQAVISGMANIYLNAVGSTLFIVAWTATATGINRLALYTLDGGTLVEIPFYPIVPFLDSVTSPEVYGDYAIFAVSYANPGGPGLQKAVSVYAYDVAYGRLFRAITFTHPAWTGNDVFGHDVIGVYGVVTRTLQPGATFQAQIGIAIFSGFLSNAVESAREFYWGVTPLTPVPSFAGLLQMGASITSGLIDFTAATKKLFRTAVARFINGLVANQPTPLVTLNAWLNQDPAQLNVVPDFSVNTGTPVSPLPTELNSFINQVGRKLVYQWISAGGGFTGGGWQNAPKLTDLIIQAATGWVYNGVLDVSPGARVNAQNVQEYCYQHQGIDHVAAYNFLRQLWRLKGGQVALTLPNLDSYNALIQSMEFASPKPVAASYRSDIEATYQVLCTIKIREDI